MRQEDGSFKWLVYDFTRGMPNDMGAADHLATRKETKASYLQLCVAMERLFTTDEVKLIPLVVTYEGTFDFPGCQMLGRELEWEPKTLE